MTIQWLGETSFKIIGKNDQKEEITILFDPQRKLKGDIVCLTNPEGNFQTTEEGLLIKEPGEYEKKGAFLKGFFENNKLFYSLELEELTLVHLGKINKPLEEKILDQLGEVDILLIGLNSDNQHLINQIEPKIFIPMNYKNLDEKLMKSLGIKTEQVLDKLTIRKKDLTDKETKGVILKA